MTAQSPDKGVTTLREGQKLLTRRRLMDSAAASLKAKGYRATSIDDIVAGAGASRGTFYLYFSSKSEIVIDLVEEGYRTEISTLMDEIQADGLRDETSIRAFIDRYVSHFRSNRAILRAWLHIMQMEPELAVKGDDIMRLQIDGLTAAISGGHHGDPERLRMLAMSMFFQLDRMCFFRFLRGWKIPDSAIDLLVEQWSQALTLR